MQYIISKQDLSNLVRIYKAVIKILANEYPPKNELQTLQKFCNNLDEALSSYRKKNPDLFNWNTTDFFELETGDKEINKNALKECLRVFDDIQSICFKYRQPVSHFRIHDKVEGMVIEL